jgi:hypothetical protein
MMELNSPTPDRRPGATTQIGLIRATSWVAALSLAALLGLRCYAAYFTVPVRTWDDVAYRDNALWTAERTSTAEAISDIVLPCSKTLWDLKTAGYRSWLTVAKKISPFKNDEFTWQSVNICLFLIDGISLFLLSWWSTRRRDFSLCLAFLLLSSPIVFGMNRWVMTENHVMTSIIVYATAGAVLFRRRERETLLLNLFWGAVAGWLFGIFGSMREYCLPTIVGIPIAAFAGLIWERRRARLAAFSAVYFPYAFDIGKALEPILKSAVPRTQEGGWHFHSLSDWIPHVALHSAGPALVSTFLILSWLCGVEALRRWRDLDGGANRLRLLLGKLSGWHIFLAGQLAVTIGYAGLILWIKMRGVRASIPLSMSIMVLLVMASRGLPDSARRRFSLCLLPLVALSWLVLGYQLFIPFNGGKTYAHHPSNLEHFNHPLHLRALRTRDDMHTTTSPFYSPNP